MAMNKDFGAFELKEKIGSGGMASVYLAVQKALQRPVVLKILYPHLAEDEKLVQRFEREARAAAMMRHENIIQVIDMGRHEDVVYIAMEFVEGMDLQKWLQAHGTPPFEMAILMIRDVCRGLEHAHSNRIVHRDVKPANIMFTPSGMIKLMDFGLARGGSETSTQMTMVGSVLGTPAYMSPEQATGETVDVRSDIFSTGVVAYELLGGTRPFTGDSYSTVLRSILTVEPPELTHFNPLVPEEVARIVRGMLQKDAARRYQQMSLVREAFEDVIEQNGLHRGRDLLREYAQQPESVSDMWRRRHLSRHLDQGLYFENMGLGKIDDALREFRRVLYLDEGNAVAKDHIKKLERERGKMEQAQAAAAGPPEGQEHTVVMTPEQVAAAMSPPAPPPAQGAPPAGGPPAAGGPAPAAPAKPAPARPAPPPPRKPAPAAPPKPAPKPAAKPAAVGRRALPIPALVTVGVLVVAAIVVGAILIGHGRSPEPEPQPVPPPPISSDSALAEGARAESLAAPAPETPPAPQGPTLVAAGAALDQGRTAEAIRIARAFLAQKHLSASARRAGMEMVARAHAHQSDPAGATRAYTELLRAFPTYSLGAGATSAERAAYEAAKTAMERAAAPPSEQAAKPQAAPTSGTASLVLRVNPFAATFAVDNKVLDRNKKTFNATLKPGHHTITVKHSTLGTKQWSVDLAAGEVKELTYDFTSNTGVISVTAEPTWGDIYLDGVRVGHTTPWKITAVPSGKHDVSLVREGWIMEGGAQSVDVQPGATLTVQFKLKQKK